MKLGYIYKITNIVNGKVYIGQTIQTLKQRFLGHIYKNGCTYLHSAIKKYGKENFKIEEIEAVPIENLNKREIYWISYYNSTDKNIGYNILDGGNLGWRNHSKLTKEEIENLIEQDKQGIPHTEICKQFCIERKTVTSILKRYSKYKKRFQTLKERSDIEELLIAITKEHLTAKQIRERFKISQAALFRLTKQHGVHFLTYRERQKLGLYQEYNSSKSVQTLSEN